jgi:hypothetical protein
MPPAGASACGGGLAWRWRGGGWAFRELPDRVLHLGDLQGVEKHRCEVSDSVFLKLVSLDVAEQPALDHGLPPVT